MDRMLEESQDAFSRAEEALRGLSDRAYRGRTIAQKIADAWGLPFTRYGGHRGQRLMATLIRGRNPMSTDKQLSYAADNGPFPRDDYVSVLDRARRDLERLITNLPDN